MVGGCCGPTVGRPTAARRPAPGRLRAKRGERSKDNQRVQCSRGDRLAPTQQGSKKIIKFNVCLEGRNLKEKLDKIRGREFEKKIIFCVQFA